MQSSLFLRSNLVSRSRSFLWKTSLQQSTNRCFSSGAKWSPWWEELEVESTRNNGNHQHNPPWHQSEQDIPFHPNTSTQKLTSHFDAPFASDYRQQFDDFLHQQGALQQQLLSETNRPKDQFESPSPTLPSSPRNLSIQQNDSKVPDDIDYSALDEVLSQSSIELKRLEQATGMDWSKVPFLLLRMKNLEQQLAEVRNEMVTFSSIAKKILTQK
eukprot:TRINITY_DN16928_c0_g1_i1.p1 TRINITY_DN16928_c0_g1~~TRINITY_DN16928_c0_g1_i1.p1  ORF type:complete len:214 (+),score=41.38 TRINITY_DN16928_c0_g1_i1:103-744(+)